MTGCGVAVMLELPPRAKVLFDLHQRSASISELRRLAHDDRLLARVLLDCPQRSVTGQRSWNEIESPEIGEAWCACVAAAFFSHAATQDDEAHWRGTFQIARCAARLEFLASRRVERMRTTFLVGLLRDIGCVALRRQYPKASRRIYLAQQLENADIVSAEIESFGLSHAAVGRDIAMSWRLPPEVVDAIGLHTLGAPVGAKRPGPGSLLERIWAAETLVSDHERANCDHGGAAAAHAGRPSAPADEIAARAREDAHLFQRLWSTSRAAMHDDRRSGVAEKRPPELHAPESPSAANDSNLDRSVRAMQILARFEAAIAAPITLEGVTEAIRDSCDAWFGERSAVFVADPLHDQLLCAAAGRRVERRALHREQHAALFAVAAREAGADREMRIVGRPPEAHRLLAEWHRGGAEGSRCISIVNNEQALGIVLLALDPGDPSSESDALARDALLRRFASAIDAALQIAHQRRMCDELAEASRLVQLGQADAVRARSLSMIAELAAGASHELNNPLSVISGRVQILLRETPADSGTHAALEQILNKAHECSRIVSDLMEFAQPRPPALEIISLPDFLSELRRDWTARVAGGIGIHSNGEDPEPSRANGAPRGPRVWSDRNQLREVIDELVHNAIAAIGEAGGFIRLSSRQLSDSEVRALPRQTEHRGARNGDGYVEIAIQDNGVGMSSSILRHAFDPFFSHRKAGRRRGLGLAWVHRVIDAQGGTVRLESRPNQGTSAFVVLPAAKNGAAH